MSRSLAARPRLPTLRPGEIVPRTPPATAADLDQYEAFVLSSFKIPGPDVIADPRQFVAAQRIMLEREGFSRPVILLAAGELFATQEWIPATASVVKTCRQIVEESSRREREQEKQRAYEASYRRRAQFHAEEKARQLCVLTEAFGPHLDHNQVEKAYEAIMAVFGAAQVVPWVQAAYEGETKWPLEAARFMATVDCKTVKSDPGEQTRVWMEYFAIRRARG